MRSITIKNLNLFLITFAWVAFVSAGNSASRLIQGDSPIDLPAGKILVRGADIFLKEPSEEMEALKYTLKEGEEATISGEDENGHQYLTIYAGGVNLPGTYGELKGDGDVFARVFRIIQPDDSVLESLRAKYATVLQRDAAGDIITDPSKVCEIKVTE